MKVDPEYLEIHNDLGSSFTRPPDQEGFAFELAKLVDVQDHVHGVALDYFTARFPKIASQEGDENNGKCVWGDPESFSEWFVRSVSIERKERRGWDEPFVAKVKVAFRFRDYEYGWTSHEHAFEMPLDLFWSEEGRALETAALEIRAERDEKARKELARRQADAAAAASREEERDLREWERLSKKYAAKA